MMWILRKNSFIISVLESRLYDRPIMHVWRLQCFLLSKDAVTDFHCLEMLDKKCIADVLFVGFLVCFFFFWAISLEPQGNTLHICCTIYVQWMLGTVGEYYNTDGHRQKLQSTFMQSAPSSSHARGSTGLTLCIVEDFSLALLYKIPKRIILKKNWG